MTLQAMLQRTAELASGQERSLEAKNRELEEQLELANKRANKAKRLARVAVDMLNVDENPTTRKLRGANCHDI